MSRTTNRDTPPRDGGSVEHRLARLLEAPVLARVVPHLPPETLHQLVRCHGLDACGALVTAATPAQLTSLLDLDLWRPTAPGRDDTFDADRFGEWLEVLVDTGAPAAARTIAALDADLVVAGLSRYVRVVDPGIFEPTAQSDDEPTDRHEAMREGDSLEVGEAWDGGSRDAASRRAGDALPHDSTGGWAECEIGGYLVRARRGDVWDAVIALLTALEDDHAGCFHAVMQGCRRLSNSRPEIDGLDDLLPAPEQHLHDVAVERERRRSQQGYATPADARAFLQMARQPGHTRRAAGATGALAVNPIVAAYFRAADETPEPPNEDVQGHERLLEGPASAPLSTASRPTGRHADATDAPESMGAVLELLAEAGMLPERPRALLDTVDADPQAGGLTEVRRLMAYVRDRDETAYLARSRELAFLANALLAGCSVQSRPFTPQEASDAAAGICNLGLEHWPSRWPAVTSPGAWSSRADDQADDLRQGSGGQAAAPADSRPPDSLLIRHDLVTAFEVGWSVLHQDVSLFVAERLIATLADLHPVDGDIRRGLSRLRRELTTGLDAGTPSRARGAAEVLAMLDMTAWIGVLGLLDECPILPAALTAVLEGRTTAVSPTAFSFISTAAQIRDVRAFMRKLPDVLSR